MNSVFAHEGRGCSHSNTFKAHNNIKYFPNHRCGYDVDHEGYELPNSSTVTFLKNVAFAMLEVMVIMTK